MCSRPAFRFLRELAAVFVLSAGLTGAAYAETLVIMGNHTKDEVNTACDKVGGTQVEGPGGKGYGCYNPKNGVLVACNDKNECGGHIPRNGSKLKTLLGVLQYGLASDTRGGTSIESLGGFGSSPPPLVIE